MKDRRTRWIASVVLVFGLVDGCAKTARPSSATQPATQPSPDTASVASMRVRELSRLSDDYSALGHQLPGRSTEEHRQLMCSVFDKLDEILPLLTDPRNDLVFREHLMVLEDARAQLAGNPPEATIAPTIDTGLRSTYNALAGIVHGKDFDASDFQAPLDDMKARLDELDTVHGLTHQVIVADAVEASSVIISKVTGAMAERIVASSSDAEAAAPPTTEPTSAPTTQPQ